MCWGHVFCVEWINVFVFGVFKLIKLFFGRFESSRKGPFVGSYSKSTAAAFWAVMTAEGRCAGC